MKYNEEQIGKLIKQEREKRNMTQAQLASELHVTNKQISNYEKAKPIPPLDKMLDLCDIFDCELGYLIGEDGYQNETQLKTAVCEATGFTMDTIKSVLDLVKDKFDGEDNKEMLNRLLTASWFPEFLDDLSNVHRVVLEYDAVFDRLEKKYGVEMMDKARKAYNDPHIDYQHDEEYQIEHPELCQIMSEIDQAIDKQYGMEYTIDVARYRLSKTMESMIDDMYPLSKYHR